MDIASLVPIANRDGLFAVVSQLTAQKLRDGRMKLYADDSQIMVETITRNRKNLLHWGNYVVVLIGLDQNNCLTLG